MNVDIARRLCDLRHTHGLSQEGLAARLGVSRQAVSKWERGESSPDTDNLLALSELYGMTIDELLGRGDAGSGTAGFAGVACHADADADALGVGAGDADTPALDDTMGDAALSDLLETLRRANIGDWTRGSGDEAPDIPLVDAYEFDVSTGEIGRLEVITGAANVYVRPVEGCVLRIEEHSTLDEERYRARILREGPVVHVEEGDAPRRLLPMQSYRHLFSIEVPTAFAGTVAVSAKSGSVEMGAQGLALDGVSLETKSGFIHAAFLEAGTISLSSKSGNVKAADVRAGELSISTTSGSIKSFDLNVEGPLGITSASGGVRVVGARASSLDASTVSGVARLDRTVVAGRLVAESVSGKLSVSAWRADLMKASSVSGSIRLDGIRPHTSLREECVSGGVAIALPLDLSFALEANSKSGDMSYVLDGSNQASAGGRLSLRWGDEPACRVGVETVSGSVRIVRGGLS